MVPRAFRNHSELGLVDLNLICVSHAWPFKVKVPATVVVALVVENCKTLDAVLEVRLKNEVRPEKVEVLEPSKVTVLDECVNVPVLDQLPATVNGEEVAAMNVELAVILTPPFTSMVGFQVAAVTVIVSLALPMTRLLSMVKVWPVVVPRV